MSALHNSEVFGSFYNEIRPSNTSSWTPTVIIGTSAPAVSDKLSAKNVALFLAAPFIGLVYAVAMPIVGLAALVWFAAKALAPRLPSAKSVALFLAAPFIGLLYALAMPLVGLGGLVWFGAKALVAHYPVSKKIALTLAAPFIGLVFIVTLPIVGLCSLAWIGIKSVTAH